MEPQQQKQVQRQQPQSQPLAAAIVKFTESCFGQALISGVVGAGAGIGMGIFFGTFEGAHGELKGNTTAEQLKYGFRKTFTLGYTRSKHLAKSFGAVGLVYAFLECNLSKFRGRADIYNAIFAGAGAGSIFGLIGLHGNNRIRDMTKLHLLRRSMVGAFGFAAFSATIELLIHNVVYNTKERSSAEVVDRF
eukprot:gb/GECG01001351.1/.p1 GENE.gb/GECG01001351.1/~~gb/GECG01001351.1/.p1  ORF type:complete len:191 (+),score=20.83 gb/GECG01001351.1/:1-573(+)